MLIGKVSRSETIGASPLVDHKILRPKKIRCPAFHYFLHFGPKYSFSDANLLLARGADKWPELARYPTYLSALTLISRGLVRLRQRKSKLKPSKG